LDEYLRAIEGTEPDEGAPKGEGEAPRKPNRKEGSSDG